MSADIPPTETHLAVEEESRVVAPESRARISVHASRGTERLLALGAAALAVLLLIGFIIAFAVHRHTENQADRLALASADATPNINVVSAKPSEHSYPLQLPGQTAGWYQSTIFARVDGYVGKWSADIGDRVKQGQVLATIDTPDLDQQLNAARAKAAASAAQVNVAQSVVSIAKVTYDRWRDSPKGVVSDQEREEKKATHEEAVARLAAAKAQAQLDDAEVGRYTAMEAFKNVTAPYDGIITARKVDVGDLVMSGSSANTTSLYSIAQSNVIRVFVDIPQKAAAEVVVGLVAHVTSEQYPGRDFNGTVARSAMSIDSQTRTQRTEVDVPNPDLRLLPGMYVQVLFELNQRKLVEVPAAAMLFRPQGLEVAVVMHDQRVEFRRVTVARDNGDTVQLSDGVQVGERVALNIASDVVPGEQVQPVAETSDAPPVQEHDASTKPGLDHHALQVGLGN